jgi:hypothetical protein
MSKSKNWILQLNFVWWLIQVDEKRNSINAFPEMENHAHHRPLEQVVAEDVPTKYTVQI